MENENEATQVQNRRRTSHLYRRNCYRLSVGRTTLFSTVTILRPSTGKLLFVSAKGGLPCLVSERDVASARELLASGVEVDSTADDCITMEPSPRGVTLLMQASWRGDKEMVKLL